MAKPSRLALVLGFLAVYLIWGSTYLAIRYTLETFPPFLMAAVRFALAGAILYVWARLKGEKAPELPHWKPALIIGGLLILVGNGGSLYSRRVHVPRSPFMVTSMQMLAGSAWLGLASLVTREPARFDVPQVSAKSVVSLLYLMVFGSLVAYTVYVWLIRVANPSVVSTYAYVNPVVAVLLGFFLAGEPISTRMIVAAAVIVSAVVLITLPDRASRAMVTASLKRLAGKRGAQVQESQRLERASS